jgi:NAD-dependent deacetylase
MIKKIQALIQNSENIVVMTGAGMSVPSGIPDFRSASGLYNDNPEEILSHSFFVSYPDKFYDFYRNKMLYPNALPNIGHKTLAQLEEKGKIKAIITQNIDGLHQLAGSNNVIELHGSIHRNYCQKCNNEYSLDKVIKSTGIPLCNCGGIIKPDVVLYEEALPTQAIEAALNYVTTADFLLVIGTSLLVHPAASLIHYFKGKNLVILNKGNTPYDRIAHLVIHEPLEKVLTPDVLN